MKGPQRFTIVRLMLAAAACYTLVVATPGVLAATGPTGELALAFEALDEGELTLEVGWRGNASTTPIQYAAWQLLSQSLGSDIRNQTTEPGIRSLADKLAEQSGEAAAAEWLLAPEEVEINEANLTQAQLYGDHLVLTLSFAFNASDQLTLHPLALLPDLFGGETLSTKLLVTAPPKVHLATSTFLLNHLRLPGGEELGGSAYGRTYLEVERASYNTSADSLTLEPLGEPFTPFTMLMGLVAFAVISLVLVLKSRPLGKRGLVYLPLVLVFYLLVSLPFSGYLFYGFIVVGLVRQTLLMRVVQKLQTKRTKVGQQILTSVKDITKAEEKESLAELSGSGNILARLFPFKIKELFMIYNDGRLVSHATLKVSGTVDSQMVSSMLTAIQDFISDSFKTGDEGGGLENIKYGKIHLYIQRHKLIYVAAVIDGNAPDTFSGELKKLVEELADDYRALLVDWDGDTTKLEPAKADMEKFIHYWSKNV